MCEIHWAAAVWIELREAKIATTVT